MKIDEDRGFPSPEDFFPRYARAVWEGDAKALLNLYSPEPVIFDLWEIPRYPSRAAWAEAMETWLGFLEGERVRVEFEELRCVSSGDRGQASAIVTFSALSEEGGELLRSMKERLSLGFVKEDSRWTVDHQHTSLPISPANREAIFFR